MDKKTTGIIATVAATLFCGCPGLGAMCFGLISAFAGVVPGSDIDIGGSSDPMAAIVMGLVALCIGVIFVVIPIAVGFFTLRNTQVTDAPISNEPIPPAI